jgi:hypothetical protein
MGLFDYIIVETDIPGYEPTEDSNPDFQTKSLDSLMEYYRITKDGDLLRKPYNSDIWQVVQYHGIINFYDQDNNNVWREYYAKFTDGKLVSITKEDPQETDSV